MSAGSKFGLSAAMGAVLSVSAPALAHAASPVTPAANQVIADTHTPTFVVQLDTTLQADGQTTDFSDGVGISVTGSNGNGGITTVALCTATDRGGGSVGCSDTAHPLPNGVYAWGFMYRTHTCIQLPPIGSFQAPPTCNFAFFPANPAGLFTISVPSTTSPTPTTTPTTPTPTTSPAGPGSTSADTEVPTLTVYGATGLHLHPLRLRFAVHDNSGEAEIALGVYSGGKAVSLPVITNCNG